MLRRHLNFRQISHRFAWSFANPSFQDLNGSHVLKYDNFESVGVHAQALETAKMWKLFEAIEFTTINQNHLRPSMSDF